MWFSYSPHSEPTFGSFRKSHTTQIKNAQGQTQRIQQLSVKCTLGDIAHATNLRVDDCRMALREAGFLLSNTRATRKDIQVGGGGGGGGSGGGNVGDEVFFISKEGVEEVAGLWGVKRMMLDVKYIMGAVGA